MEQPGGYASPEAQVAGVISAAVVVPVRSLRPADSPRLNGEDKAHIARLAETETPLPAILVYRPTMRVIDGMHRLMAASLQGRESIDVLFFDGSEADAFLRGVQENVTHGLPLSQADRRAAAERIIASHPHMSDRAIGQVVGQASSTVAIARKRSSEQAPRSSARVGRDGRVRPLDRGIGRRRAAELLTEQPDASLRDVARGAGISPATVLDVRKRLDRGESPVSGKPVANDVAGNGARTQEGNDDDACATDFPAGPQPSSRSAAALDPAATVEKLLHDPSLRDNEQGRRLLRLLHINAAGADQLSPVVADVPIHCVPIVVNLARYYAEMWQDFAQTLDGRALLIDPLAATVEPPAAEREGKRPA